MNNRQHLSASWQRNHAAGQRRIKHVCGCGKVLVGNAAWASHTAAAERHGTADEHHRKVRESS